MKIISLQPSEWTDQLAPDGTELTRQPYPFHVEAATGMVQRQDFWRGDPLAVIGFAARLDVHSIDLSWEAAAADPQRAVGMYVVTADNKGRWSTHQSAIRDVTMTEA